MIQNLVPSKARESILEDAIRRDLTTARRAALLNLLWNERFLTRKQLILRIEQILGLNCFGKTAWKDNFYRDMRVVKQAFGAAGMNLSFSRKKQSSGYYLVGYPVLSSEIGKIIRSSSEEVDLRQIDIYAQLSPSERFRQGCVVSDTARNVVAYRIRSENPDMTPAEANRIALRRAYAR